MSEWREAAGDLHFPEGPIACGNGDVMVVEIAAGRISRVAPDGARSIVANTGGGPNGMAVGPDGRLYVCNNGGFEFGHQPDYDIAVPVGKADDYSGGSIQRVDPRDGRVETLYSGAGETPLRGPNDIVFDAFGGFWFTDHGKSDHRSRDRVGVFYAKADGSGIEEVIFPLENPNGIGLSPDGRTLYVAETFTCQLWAFDLDGPGRIRRHPNLFGHGGRFVYRPAGFRFFDSLAIEACGNICVATIGEPGISVVSPAGDLVEFVATADIFTTNICFGGPGMTTAWATLSGQGKLVTMEWARPGLVLEHTGLLR